MRGWLAVAIVLTACGSRSTPPIDRPSTRPPPPNGLWVLAPHPDDEALIAAHVIATAVREGRDVHVVLMTNGDLGCERDGWARQRETIAAMAELGLAEDRIRFLGYPDGHLAELGREPLAPLPRRGANGECTTGNTTYGARGEGGLDVHRARTGQPGLYTERAVVEDLAALLTRDRPRDVYVTHPVDDHPDHAATYVLFRRALERARIERLPVVHRAIVHAGPCWPNGSGTREPCPLPNALGRPYPPLPPPIDLYVPNERVPVPDGGALGQRAIAHYRSQLHTDVRRDWLGTFSRADAVYFREELARDHARIVRAGGDPVAARYEVRVDSGQARVHSPDGRVLAALRVRTPREGEWDVRATRRREEGAIEVEVRQGGRFAAVVLDFPHSSGD